MKAVILGKNTIVVSEVEAKIVSHYANGLAAKEIGEKLKISHRTVESHIANLKRTFDCNSVTHLVAHFLREGLIK